MIATNRWQVLVLVTSLALIVFAMLSKTLVIGADDLRAGLWSHGDLGDELDGAKQLQAMGMVTGLLALVTGIALAIVVANAWMQQTFSTSRTLALAGILAQLAAGLVFTQAKAGDLRTQAGPAFTLFLVGSMGALIATAALEAKVEP